MVNLFQTPVLALLGLQWWQWLLVVLLIVLIIVYFQMRKRQM